MDLCSKFRIAYCFNCVKELLKYFSELEERKESRDNTDNITKDAELYLTQSFLEEMSEVILKTLNP